MTTKDFAFLEPVWIRRGSIGRKHGPGRDRQVRGHFLRWVDEHNVSCALAEDDLGDTVGWRRCGDVGTWSESSVGPRTVDGDTRVLDEYTNERTPTEIWAAACETAVRQVEAADFESQGEVAISEAQRLLSLAWRLSGKCSTQRR